MYKRHILPLFACLFLGMGWSAMGQATITSSSVAANNSTVSVTFSEAVFSGSGGSGALDAADFVLGISGGTATLGATTPTSISVSGNTYTLGVILVVPQMAQKQLQSARLQVPFIMAVEQSLQRLNPIIPRP